MRGRSLSPLSDDFLETEESSDGSEEIGYDSAPVLELMANMEAENIELVYFAVVIIFVELGILFFIILVQLSGSKGSYGIHHCSCVW